MPRSSSIHKLFAAGHMTQIKKLIMKGQSLDSRGMVSVARALHSHPGNTLQTLDLSSNTIGVAGSIALARLIEDGNLVLLRQLRFSSCWIDGEQMEAIVQGIESGLLFNLEHLDVSWNKFCDQVCRRNWKELINVCKSNYFFFYLKRKHIQLLISMFHTLCSRARLGRPWRAVFFASCWRHAWFMDAVLINIF